MSPEFGDRSPESHLIKNELLSVADEPIELLLADQRLMVVDPVRDLHENVTWNCDYLIIDPVDYDPRNRVGYKGLRENESVVLGRESDYGRFVFNPTVSRRHVRMEIEDSLVRVVDLGSLNSTYLLKRPSEYDSEGGELVDGVESKKNEFSAGGKSIASLRHPHYNDDAYFIDERSQSFGVFDGVANRPGSARAAQLAAQKANEALSRTPSRLVRQLGNNAVLEALWAGHHAITKENTHIATTATIAKIYENESGSHYISIGSVGDSRAYLHRDDDLEHMTLDQAYMSMVSPSDAMQMQKTLSRATDLSRLSHAELTAFRERNKIFSFLGIENRPPTVVVKDFELAEGDRILLTSDGIHDNLTTGEINEVLSNETSADVAADRLVNEAQQRSLDKIHSRSKHDDMTAVVVDYKK